MTPGSPSIFRLYQMQSFILAYLVDHVQLVGIQRYRIFTDCNGIGMKYIP